MEIVDPAGGCFDVSKDPLASKAHVGALDDRRAGLEHTLLLGISLMALSLAGVSQRSRRRSMPREYP